MLILLSSTVPKVFLLQSCRDIYSPFCMPAVLYNNIIMYYTNIDWKHTYTHIGTHMQIERDFSGFVAV